MVRKQPERPPTKEDTERLIATCEERRRGYPEEHGQIPKIDKQVEGLRERC